LYALFCFTVALGALSLVLGLFAAVDWEPLAGPLVSLLIMLGILYWTTTLLPGPVKKVGRSVGRQIVKSVQKNRSNRH
jgi:predicted transporter